MIRPLREQAIDHPDANAAVSLMDAGPLYRLQRAVGLAAGPYGYAAFGIIIGLLIWTPLVGLAAVAGTLTDGAGVSFIYSVGTHVRLLVAIPLFFFTEAVFDVRARQASRILVVSGVVPVRQLPSFNAAWRQAKRWNDAWLLEAVLVVITILLIRVGVRTDLPGEVSTWRESTGGFTNMAGWWYSLISLPVYQFLLWRWCARLLIWWRLLWRVARLDLQLEPTHPDLAGGLGVLGVVHVALAPLNIAMCGMFVASLIEELWFAGTNWRQVVLPLTVTIIANTSVLIAPLVFFVPALLGARQQGLLEYGELASEYTRAFHAKWVQRNTPATEPLLGTADVQSLADLANSFDVIRQMRIVPIARNQVLTLLGAAAFPAAPLILFAVPLDELIIRSVQTLLHL